MLRRLTQLEDMITPSSISQDDKSKILALLDEVRLEYISAKISYRFTKLYNNLRVEILQYEKEEPFLLKKINELSALL